MKKVFLLLSFLSIAVFSCRKDGGSDGLPTITWNSPTNGIQINVFDTLLVDLHLEDNLGLVNLDVKLLDEQMVPVLPTVTVPLHGRSQDVTFDFPVSSIRIASGTYYLYADVSNAHNQIRSYRTINITGVPRALKGIFVATNPVFNTTNIYKVDTSWAASNWLTETNNLTDMAVNPYWQQLYVNGNSNRTFHTVSIDGSTPGWSVTPVVTTQPFWGPISVKGTRLWVSYRSDDKIRSLDETGAIKVSCTGDIGFYPNHCLQVGNKLISEQIDPTNNNSVKLVTYTTTGPALQETMLGMTVVEMFEQNDNSVYVLGNSGGQGHLKIYDVAGNGMWEPMGLPSGMVTSAAQVDSNTVLIGMSTGSIYKFTYNPVGLLTWASGINATQLRYNDVDDNVFSAEGLNVKVYSYNPFSLQRTIAIPDSVKDVELWYNR